MRFILSIFTGLVVITASASAQDVWITPEIPFVEIEIGDEFIVIERNQDNEAVIASSFAKTSRPCPPFCVQPMVVTEGVVTVGEIEVLQFLEDLSTNGNAYLVDARTPGFYEAGTIPGSINLPFNMFAPSDTNPFMTQILIQLGGVEKSDGKWDLTAAPKLLLFCNGPWCGQSPRAIENLIAAGYPPEKLLYYRGGMQNWLMLGLSVVVP